MSDDEDCPGEGKCHGCMCWCDRCGDVDLVCNYPTCQQHHCSSCRELLGPDDAHNDGGPPARCATCALASVNEDVLSMFESAIKRGDFNKADELARDLVANPTPRWPVAVPWTYHPLRGFA